MIGKLRIKLIIIAMASLAGVLILMTSLINAINYWKLTYDADRVLQVLYENNGHFPIYNYGREDEQKDEEFNAESEFETRYFTVYADERKQADYYNLRNISAVDEDGAKTMADAVFRTGDTRGYEGNYRFFYGVGSDEYGGYMVVFLDCTRALANARDFLISSVFILVIALTVVFILIYVFSRGAVAPMAESYERQKSFITNASHELRTPVAIISTYADLLEIPESQREWVDGIKKQTERLTQLTANLTSLARMDESAESMKSIEKCEFQYSEAVTEIAGQFVSLADSRGKHMSVQIEDGLVCSGNEDMLKKLVHILLDNAVKYSSDEIRLITFKEGRKIQLTVANTVEQIEKGNLDRFFDRFYRSDKQNSNKVPGYGIGLSIAKSIVEAHNGRIGAKSADGKSFEICAKF